MLEENPGKRMNMGMMTICQKILEEEGRLKFLLLVSKNGELGKFMPSSPIVMKMVNN